ncbi:nipsnap family protein [Cryptococcus bacillisporus CA1873]|uniref:Nipsnap family protein n=1 Tax=Cryptococcus bacillisporus CA1873 TaxID=1296111 RepID=A0ABR5B6I5_CRYGA|nr:nipsnap family protein [Cryptococcus bacillisporus CA1873]|eukprot:KIR59204.1 nipsnap family protein [Cryptococcus gattii CA1873]
MAFLRATARASPLTSLSRTPFALAALHTSRPILHPAKTAPDGNIPPAAVGGERVPASQEDDPKQGGEGFFGAIFWGSKAAKAEGLVDPDPSKQAHSTIVGRGKYVHEKITHAVIPSHRAQYLASAEKYFTSMMQKNGELGGVKLMGSWESIVGDVGSFTHILEYEGYKGFDVTRRAIAADPEMSALQSAILPHVTSRQHQLLSEFSFWPSSPPHDSGYPDGGVFEMRSYLLQPGKLLEWEYAWRKGLEARKRFVQPVGAFFSQAGQLHEVHHIWQYPDMAARKRTRDQAWSIGSWADTVRDTVKLAYHMKSTIMVPCPWSPIR